MGVLCLRIRLFGNLCIGRSLHEGCTLELGPVVGTVSEAAGKVPEGVGTVPEGVGMVSEGVGMVSEGCFVLNLSLYLGLCRIHRLCLVLFGLVAASLVVVAAAAGPGGQQSGV